MNCCVREGFIFFASAKVLTKDSPLFFGRKSVSHPSGLVQTFTEANKANPTPKYNGILPMESLPSQYEEINCKNVRNCQIEFVAFEKKESENYKQKYKVVRFFRCEHDHACDGVPVTSRGEFSE